MQTPEVTLKLNAMIAAEPENTRKFSFHDHDVTGGDCRGKLEKKN